MLMPNRILKLFFDGDVNIWVLITLDLEPNEGLFRLRPD